MEKIWFLLLVPMSLVHYFMVCSSMAAPTNLATDKLALQILKAHITSDPYNILTYNWTDTSTSCCDWIGVTCGIRHQRVTSLNLADMGLTGTIPSHLGNLSFLASLDIHNNSFHGHLPDQLSFLRRLKVINLRLNNLEGIIPSTIFNISFIEIISIADNKLSGSLPTYMSYHLKALALSNNQLSGPIPNAIWNHKKLMILSLSYNQFEGSIPREIGNLTSIKELYLSNNNFIGEIPEEVGYLHRLEYLSLSKNKPNGSIPPALFNISSLIQISLANNSLSGSLPLNMCYHLQALVILNVANNKIMGTIPQGIGNCSSLEFITLVDNILIGAMPYELGSLPNLVDIRLDINGLNGSIPLMIFNISTLEIISLVQNNLSGQLPPSIGFGIPNLKELYLGLNQLSGIIPSSISNASKLIYVELGQNSFTGFIPNTFGNLRLLEWLNIDDNYLITESSTQELGFLTSLTNCQHLRSLAISRNPLNGTLPTSIGNFSASLEYFYAGECNIKGYIPTEIGNLSNLILLSLGSNQLVGTIPPTVGRLEKLQVLDVHENKLQGSIPYYLCHLRSLFSLYLSRNELSGPIPACISNLTSLLELRLNSNKLMSIIPLALTTLTDILTLDLSTNSLRGHLPPEMGRLKVVRVIDLSLNHLSGNISSTIGSLQRLRALSLSHNEFQGPIPPSFGDLVSLELLSLSHNNLSGVIPKSLEKLGYLKILNVSSNRLQGEIPNGGPFVNFSAQSFMLNDVLCGAPRFQVPQCKTDTPQRSRTTVVSVLKYGLPAIVITVIVLLFVLIRYRKKNKRLPTRIESLPTSLRRISYQEIFQATDGFNECNLLGNGSFGHVYRGVLSDGLTVAVKVFNLQLEAAFKSFDVECEVLRNIRHRNLVKIISSCSNDLDFKALVLEFMPNGSLEKWLYSHNYYLNILQRLNVVMDVAFALEYLHHGYSTPIIHCDIKPNNILLDGDMVAHVGDFGISKLLGEGEFMKQTVTLATIGYMAPEYGIEGIVSISGDVFSYGIMLMETFTRKKPTDETFTGEMSLKRWVSDSLHCSITEVADPNLLRREDEHYVAKEKCVYSVLSLALKCTEDSLEERLNMKDIVQGLMKIRSTLVAHFGRT